MVMAALLIANSQAFVHAQPSSASVAAAAAGMSGLQRGARRRICGLVPQVTNFIVHSMGGPIYYQPVT